MARCVTIIVNEPGGVPQCSSDADCPAGQVCSGGTCVDSGGNGNGGDGRSTVALLALGGIGLAIALRRRS